MLNTTTSKHFNLGTHANLRLHDDLSEDPASRRQFFLRALGWGGGDIQVGRRRRRPPLLPPPPTPRGLYSPLEDYIILYRRLYNPLEDYIILYRRLYNPLEDNIVLYRTI